MNIGGEVLRAHHYCSSNAISALTLNSAIRYANFTLEIFLFWKAY